jgi:hypothetical protein
MRTEEEMDLMHYSKPKNRRFVDRFWIFHKIKTSLFSLSDLHPPLIMRTDEEMDLLHYSKPKNRRLKT